MLILGIETSCDETAAATVENGTKVISGVVASSQSMHAKFGGIIPDKAAREQLKSVIPVLHETLSSGKIKKSQIDAIAVTVGPGLIGSLLVGVETAKSLALAWHKPIVPVNHLIGHIYANWLTLPQTSGPQLPTLPALVLLVSGGHTELILVNDHSRFVLLGSTRDDAAGECLDKCARLLNLGYPGGPAIELAAQKLKTQNTEFKTKLPHPMINDKNLDFSFSGLKTAVANLVRSAPGSEPQTSNLIARELQEAITDVLVSKTIQAAEKHRPKSILLAGGVAANNRLREKLRSALSSRSPTTNLFVPPISLCTDNAAMIASAACFNYKPLPPAKINTDPALSV